ncbi:MAG: hypothetical protein WC715_03440 [Patescibacteria group bacterium]|jgi:hydroxymethylpyrimidine pyrophosphatase-like HAD family hydrolase
MKNSKNKSKKVNYAWLFDVDGVLTHLEEKRVTEKEIITELIGKLKAGEPVILNTGRALDFMDKKIVQPLGKALKDKTPLGNFLAVGEKGGVVMLFDSAGKKKFFIDKSISVPPALGNEVRDLIRRQFSKTMFFDATKKTMISAEMNDGLEIKKFRPEQKKLIRAMEKMLARRGLARSYKIDPTISATDIENKHAGKHLGVQRALSWLREKKIRPKQFIAFGDSRSDLAMARELKKEGLKMEFVFVGKKEILSGERLNFPVVYTKERYEAGVMEYFKSHR